MKLPHSSLVFWLCISYVNCYFYPVCYPNNGDIFDLKYTFQDVVNTLKSKIFNAKKEGKIECDNNNKELYSFITTILLDFIKFYNYYLQDMDWDDVFGSDLSTEYPTLHLYPYIPPLLQKKKKVKTDGRLYLLFIGGTLTVYLLLYAYFSKKLSTFYQSNIKKQYINNIKKIFKQK